MAYLILPNLLSIIYYLRRVLDELEPPERPPPLLLPPLKPPEERVDVDDGRYVDVERVVVDDELLTLEELRVVEEERTTDVVGLDVVTVGVTSRDVVGRAGNAVVVVLRRCALVDADVLLEVDAPRTVDVDTLLSLIRRTAVGDDVATLLEAATFVAKREVLLTLRRSFSLPRAT